MFFNLFPGEVLHIGEGITLTVLAVEGDLIRLGLETPQGERSGVLNTGEGCGEGCGGGDLQHRRKGWELN